MMPPVDPPGEPVFDPKVRNEPEQVDSDVWPPRDI